MFWRGGHVVPVNPWERWLHIAPAKRDALIALALDEAASHIVDKDARTAVRSALIRTAERRIRALSSVTSQRTSASAVGTAQAALTGRFQAGKPLSALQRIGRNS